jgi:hypothetical protein
MQVFGKQWFRYHTDKLTKLANTGIGRLIFGISDKVNKDDLIIDVGPNYVSVLVGVDVHSGATIRTKFFGPNLLAHSCAKNLGWLWRAMHWMDSLVLDRQQLVPDFGFNSLTTFYTEDGNGPNESVDAFCINTDLGVSWEMLQGGAGNGLTDSTTIGIGLLAFTSQYSNLKRSVMAFDTNVSILQSGEIIDADVRLYHDSSALITTFWDADNHGLQLFEVNGHLAASGSVQAADFAPLGLYAVQSSARIATLLSKNVNTTAWNTLGFGGTHLNYIQTTGYTEIGMNFIHDWQGIPGGDAPSWSSSQNSYVFFESSTHAGGHIPELIVESRGYTVLNIGDDWKQVTAMKINIGDAWKVVSSLKLNIGDAWRTIF